MKTIPFAFLMLLVLACSLDKGKEASDVALGDTVTTASGVRYFYLKKGEGRAGRNRLQTIHLSGPERGWKRGLEHQ